MNSRAPLLVGLVLVLTALSLSFFFIQTSKDRFDDASTYPVYADFLDASGVRDKTRVQVNGIDVGKIVSIEHVRTPDGMLRARVNLRIHKNYVIYDNAVLKKTAESLLGDFRLDLQPGSPPGHPLRPGEGIADARSASEIDEIKSQLVLVSRHINDITESFSKVLSGPEGEGSLKTILNKVELSMNNIEQTTHALEQTIVGNDKVISAIIANVGHISESLAQISAPGGDLVNTSRNLSSLTAKLEKMADTVNEMLVGRPDATPVSSPAEQQTESLRQTLSSLNESISRLNQVARKVDEGQGTLGRLVNDPGIAERVENTLDSANEIIGSISSVETQIELRSEYNIPFKAHGTLIAPAIKNTLGLRIRPKPDKFYILEAVADPRGRQTSRIISDSIGANNIVTNETVISFNDLKFTAEFAKTYYFFTVRFGIIENTGGLGADLHFLDNRLEVRLDAFDFNRTDPNHIRPIFPRLRALGIYELVGHLHLQLGFDDPLNQELSTWFLGGILRFTDDDLKALLALAPKP